MGPTPCFSLKASKASCVLNNDDGAAAACFPLTPCFASEIQNDSQPFPSTLSLINKPAGVSLRLDQSFDPCCWVTFPDPTGASRVGTLAGAPGNYLDGGVVGGCHRALVFLMSPDCDTSLCSDRQGDLMPLLHCE